MGSSVNRPKIAGHRLGWIGVDLFEAVTGEKIGRFEKLRDPKGRPLKGVDGFGQQYKAFAIVDGQEHELGIGLYTSGAKHLVDSFWAQKWDGRHEGYWSSYKGTVWEGSSSD